MADTLQELAKKLLTVDFVACECDDVYENSKLYDYLLPELVKRDKETVVRFFFDYLQAKECNAYQHARYKGERDNPFESMLNFESINEREKLKP